MEPNRDNSLDRDNSLNRDKSLYKPLSVSGQQNLPGIPDDMVIVIDKEKLPEDIRKMIDEVLSLGQPKSLRSIHEKDREAKPLFALQTGTVVGNIYDKNFKLDNR